MPDPVPPANLGALAQRMGGLQPPSPWWFGPVVWDDRQTNVAVSPGVDTVLCAVQPARRLLILSSPVAGGVFVGINANLATSQGILLSSSTGPLVLDYERFGSLVTDSWTAISTAGVTVSVFELIFRPDRIGQ